MRIAIVGSGIAGLASAWLLSRRHEVVLYESANRLGGHTHTHDVTLDGRRFRVDTGFIVMNPEHYPLLTRLFEELGVRTQPTTMSFSVHSQRTGLEYNAGTLDGLFSQRRNLVSPRFLRMVRDILRFYREAPALLAAGPDPAGTGPTLGAYLAEHGYSEAFRDEHIVPMASALWSSPSVSVLDFPARFLVRFMANHQMLQAAGRPQWRTVVGGSSSYIDAMRARWNVTVRMGAPVVDVRRRADGRTVDVTTREGADRFDQVVLACHGDQALALLSSPHPAEREILGAFTCQHNETILHTDARVLPVRRKAWAAWNAWLPADPAQDCTVSYLMNQLQSLDAPVPLIVSLNMAARVDPSKIIARMNYRHPLYTARSVAAQSRSGEINGHDRLWYAGAYWGWGFHEDGLRSAVEVVRGLGTDWP